MPFSYPPGTGYRLTGASPEFRTAKGEQTVLGYVNIHFTSTSATLALYSGPFPNNGTPSTNGTQVANIDCSSNSSRALTYMIRCQGGLYGVLTPAATGAEVNVCVI